MIDLTNGLPDCGVEDCEDKGRFLLAGTFVCGKHLMRYEEQKNKQVLEGIK